MSNRKGGRTMEKDSNRVIIFDTTLRDGEQSPGASMNAAEKLRLALQLEKLGVDVIEAGFPAASDGDFMAVKRIAETLKGAQIAALARTIKEDINRAWQAIKFAAKPRIHTFIATSDIHLIHKLHKSREQVLAEAVAAVKYAKELCNNIEFSAEDATRSDPDYLCQIFQAVVEAGATTINIPDTVGYTSPIEFKKIILTVKEAIKDNDKVVISVHCHNDLGLATANTIAGIEAGARQAEVTINGIGERAGNSSLEELAMFLRTKKEMFPYYTNLNTPQIHKTSRLVSLITGMMVQPNKAIVGANAFAHEAGIHQDGVAKNPLTYEIMKPEDVGLDGNKLVMGKHSGKTGLYEKLLEMGFKLSTDELKRVSAEIKRLADAEKNVTDDDIEAIVLDEVFRKGDDKFGFVSQDIVALAASNPNAKVTISIDGEHLTGEETALGPFDAIFNAIRNVTGNNTELLRFSVSGVTAGTDALGEVTVRLKRGSLITLGKASSPNTLDAAAKAYINGLNNLHNMKENPDRIIRGGEGLGKAIAA